MFGLTPGQLGLLAILLILPILPNLWSIWHIFNHEFHTTQEKMAWIAAAVFAPVLGGLAYIVFGKKRVRKDL